MLVKLGSVRVVVLVNLGDDIAFRPQAPQFFPQLAEGHFWMLQLDVRAFF